MIVTGPRCFNPCCVGSVASTRGGSVEAQTAVNVSILVVLDRSRQPQRRRPARRRPQVSILVVLDRSRQPSHRPRSRRERRPGFNPCCVGSVASTLPGIPATRTARVFQSLLCWIGRVNHMLDITSRVECPVSILVVLDRSRQRGTVPPGARLKSKFQSLLCWIGRVNWV